MKFIISIGKYEEREREREREKEKQKNLILRVIKSNENISFRKLIVKFELLNA